ncbi:TonB-dependent receptor [Sphingobium sp. CECT 9361]|uniref:TonB-dependent receptor n=1 Tax=Sphingobium sp. CECT 9361 TaxID=2845384 RepID=UPI001E454193|nr:TonB-dependent receptor [Sphingobium sp. CECT 9361]CAH0357052.1 Fe(3+)-pyochelin receptor [Sphingobium sp. CECT 9361]
MRGKLFSSVAVAAVIMSTQAAAQSQSTEGATEEIPSGIADIVVTAERRSSSVQTTPIAISAVSGEALRERNIVDVEGLSTNIPNLTFNRVGSDARVFIRGIGYNAIAPGGEGRVAIYSDNIYQSRNQTAFLGFYDIDRIEVLRGPQGTLYGRNSIAGAINFLTRDPGTELNGYVTGEVGNYGLIATEGAVGGPLSSDVAARISFRTINRNGYGRNITTGEDVNDENQRSVRAKLRFTPSSNLTVGLTGDYTKLKDHSGGYRYAGRGSLAIVPVVERLGLSVPTDPQDAAGAGPRRSLETWSISGQADLDMSDNTRFTVLGGYRKFDFLQESSIDGSEALLGPIFIREKAEIYSAELRLSQKIGEFADLIVGGYYFNEVNTATNQVPFKGLVFAAPFGLTGVVDPNQYYEFYGSYGRVNTDAYAAFGQLNIRLSDQWSLDLGARYSHETKDLDEQLQTDLLTPFVRDNALNTTFNPAAGSLGGTTNQTKTWTSFDPKATLSFKATRDIMFYATYSEGFKSGGYNIGGLQAPFNPETLTNYEIGIKADLFDRRLRVNLSAFNYDYTDLQESIIVGTVITTKNATSARVRGMEAEITGKPTDNLTMSLNVAYLDQKFKQFFDFDGAHANRATSIDPATGGPTQDLTGYQLPGAPNWQVGGEIGYTIASPIGDFTPRANVTWYDRVFFNHFNTVEASQPSRTMVNLFLGWQSTDASWSASAYVKNLTDDTYISSTNVNLGLLGFSRTAAYGAPRTVGLSVTKKF